MRIESKTGRSGFFFFLPSIKKNYNRYFLLSLVRRFFIDIFRIKFDYLLDIRASNNKMRVRKLTRRPNQINQVQKFSESKIGRIPDKYNRPFWLPALNFYILSVVVAIAFFFLIWGILSEGGEDFAWLPAAFVATVILCGAVFLREVVLRKARNQFLLTQRRLDKNLKSLPLPSGVSIENKLTLEKNARIIDLIRHKSEAAKTLKRLPEAHLEVFESCNEYLSVNKKALETVNVGSPRLIALRRGREVVKQLHKFHLLTWAEMESRLLTKEAQNQVKISEKLKNAQKAQSVLESALQFYPNETQLKDSEEALKEFVASIKISHWIEQAERAAFKENYKRAISCYRDALFFLTRGSVQSEEKEGIAEKINLEIEKIRQIQNGSENTENLQNT